VLTWSTGAYDGADAIERAFADFQEGKLKDARTGIMIHHVIDEVDRGEPILIREIECKKGENLEQLKERIHVHEHQLIVEATEKVISEILTRKDALSTDGR
jgi:phosphoribosylglycinamide formyltransferase